VKTLVLGTGQAQVQLLVEDQSPKRKKVLVINDGIGVPFHIT